MTTLSIAAALIAINLLTFFVFWFDKEAARAGEWRVPESTLLGLAMFGGSIGAVAAQRLLRHKMRKKPFRTKLNLIIGFQFVIVPVGIWQSDWLFRSLLQIS